MTPRQNFMSVESGMAGTYRGRSRHRLPRREGARSAGRTGGVPQYVPADRYPPLPRYSCKSVSGVLSLLSTWHSVPADFLAAGSNLNGGAPSFRPDAGRLQQGVEQAVSRQCSGSEQKRTGKVLSCQEGAQK